MVSVAGRATPDFICIGSRRCGTTWLYRMMRRVPQLWLAPIKELHYFDSIDTTTAVPSPRYERHLKHAARVFAARVAGPFVPPERLGVDRNEELAWFFRYLLGPRSDAWYLSLFADAAARGKIVGEFTPDYCLLSRPFVEHIHSLNPAMKIVCILRDPIERSWSQAVKDLVRDGGRKFGEISREEMLAYLKGPECFRRSDYAPFVKLWREIFSPEQVLVTFYDEIDSDPGGLVKRVAEFAGASQTDVAVTSERVNATAASLVTKVPADYERALAQYHIEGLRELVPLVGGSDVRLIVV